MSHSAEPLIVEIKRLSSEDGPGLRDVVFFKGCPLRCDFCHNPECQTSEAEIAFDSARCIECGACQLSCKNVAILPAAVPRIARDLCLRCGACASACPTSALRLIGRRFTIPQLLDYLLRDEPFFRHSSGGVSLSGGECTLHLDYASRLAEMLCARNIPVALQTCGEFHWEQFATTLLPFVDLVFFDLKIADEQDHRRHIGASNAKIHENLRRLLGRCPDMVHPRIPLVPGITDSPDNLAALAGLLVSCGAKRVSLLPYNPLGLDMYRALGRPQPNLPKRFLTPQELSDTHHTFQAILCTLGMDSTRR